MEIFGLEINRAKKASVSAVATSGQTTQPSVPLKSASPRAEFGDSGTRGMHGVITEEYNPQLQGIQGVRKFDEMRKNDGTVRAAMLVTTLPIRRASWYIKPASEEDPRNGDIAEFVEDALFEWIEGMTWNDIIRQALLMVPFGVMVFEKVYGVKTCEGVDYVVLKKLAPRLPSSIQQWELTDGTFGIQQIRQDGKAAQIPGSKLLIFVNEKEGDNWWGTSMLRGAYKHWYYKDGFYKIDAVAFERQGLGVPVMYMPVGYTESDETKARTAMQNLRANEEAFLILPPEYKAEFLNMGSNSVRLPDTSIAHHDKAILQSVLAQFLELGASSKGSGGSRALSTDHSDLFLKAMEAIAYTIVDVINRDLIKELVDLNFDNVTDYPKLDFAGIDKVDITALADAYKKLSTAGVIDPTDDDQQYIRGALGLPPRSQEDIDEAKATKESMPTDTTVEDPNGMTVDNAADKAAPEDQNSEDAQTVDNAAKKKPTPAKASEKFSEFKSWRPLTFTEQKVSWDKIQTTIDTMEEAFKSDAVAMLIDAKDAFMVKLQKAVDQNDNKAITDLEVKFTTSYKSLLKERMKAAYEYGKNNVSTEMGVAAPANSSKSLSHIDLLADTISFKTAGDLEAKAKIAITNAMKKMSYKPGFSVIQSLGTIDAMLEDAIDAIVGHTSAIIISQNLNNGRNDVFQKFTDDIYALQRSELLDRSTCDFCLSMDGLVVKTDDDWAKTDIFHENCRGIWVEILKDEENPPPVTGIPDELASYYGGQPNELIQPPKPIIQEDSPAADEVQRRKDAKKKK